MVKEGALFADPEGSEVRRGITLSSHFHFLEKIKKRSSSRREKNRSKQWRKKVERKFEKATNLHDSAFFFVGTAVMRGEMVATEILIYQARPLTCAALDK